MPCFLTVLLFLGIGFSLQASAWENKTLRGKIGGIKILVNGEAVQLSEQPFVLNKTGATMVSLRDLAQTLGFVVTWDDATRVIHLDSDPQKRWRGLSTQNLEEMKVIRNVGPFYQTKNGNHMIAGRSFERGVVVDISKDKPVVEFGLDLNQRYTTLAGYHGVEDLTMNSSGSYTLRILGDDRELFSTGIIKPSDYPQFIAAGEIVLDHINRLVFVVNWEEAGVGDYDPVKVVLANLHFLQKP